MTLHICRVIYTFLHARVTGPLPLCAMSSTDIFYKEHNAARYLQPRPNVHRTSRVPNTGTECSVLSVFYRYLLAGNFQSGKRWVFFFYRLHLVSRYFLVIVNYYVSDPAADLETWNMKLLMLDGCMDLVYLQSLCSENENAHVNECRSPCKNEIVTMDLRVH